MNGAYHIPTALEFFKGSAYSVQYNVVVSVRCEFSSRFGGGGPIRIDKEVGLHAVIYVVTNIPRLQAKCDIGYRLGFECHVSITLLQHSDYINPPRVLDQNVPIPANVIGDEYSSHMSSWGENCCKGGFDDVAVGLIGC